MADASAVVEAAVGDEKERKRCKPAPISSEQVSCLQTTSHHQLLGGVETPLAVWVGAHYPRVVCYSEQLLIASRE